MDYGVAAHAPVSIFDPKYPGQSVDYTLDLTDVVDPVVDLLASVSVMCAPSGSGEMQISDLQVAADALTVTFSGGQPGRIYTILYAASAFNGRVFDCVARMTVDKVRVTDVAQTVPTEDFGTPLIWVAP